MIFTPVANFAQQSLVELRASQSAALNSVISTKKLFQDTKIDFHQPKFEPRPSGHVIAARITSENPDEGIFSK